MESVSSRKFIKLDDLSIDRNTCWHEQDSLLEGLDRGFTYQSRLCHDCFLSEQIQLLYLLAIRIVLLQIDQGLNLRVEMCHELISKRVNDPFQSLSIKILGFGLVGV